MTTASVAAPTLLQAISRRAQIAPHAVAYRTPEGVTLPYGELVVAIAALRERLQNELTEPAVIVLSTANHPLYAVGFLATLAAGHTVFPVSCEAADAELFDAAAKSKASAVIGDKRSLALLGNTATLALPIDSIGGQSDAPLPTTLTGSLLLQSSGTTGLPKIIRRTGRSLDAAAVAMARSIGFQADDTVLMTVPLTHSYGLEHGLLAPLWAGSAVHLCRNLSLTTVLPELKAGGVTVLPGVPSTFEMLARVSDTTASMPTLRLAYSAGAPLPRSVFDAFHSRFGIPVTQLYGASEIGSVTYNPPGGDLQPASVGRAMEGVSIRILDVEDPTIQLSTGVEGQIAVRASSMLDGYLNGAAHLIDGHYTTGDLGTLDATGRLTITGRIKLLIDVGGMKVNPLEVESVLEEHPAVAACVVVATQQSETVYRLKAIITPTDAASGIPVDELRQLARTRLAGYKVPRVFEVRDVLPRSASGKVLRSILETT